MGNNTGEILTKLTLANVDVQMFSDSLEWVAALVKRSQRPDQTPIDNAIGKTYLRLRMFDFAETYLGDTVRSDVAIRSMYNWLRDDIPGNNPANTVVYAESYRAAGCLDRAGLLEARAANKYFARGDFRAAAARLEVAVCDFAGAGHRDLQRRHLDLANKVSAVVEAVTDHRMSLAGRSLYPEPPVLEEATG